MPPIAAVTAPSRFGLGPRPGEVNAARSDPRGWLKAQLDAPDRSPAGPRSIDRIRAAQAARADDSDQAKQQARRAARQLFEEDLADRQLRRIQSAIPFRERLASFWSNHFTVSVRQGAILPVACLFEQEAIAPRLSGSFADMLLAVAQHPAMLVYLDNQRSIGPESPAGKRLERRGRDRGLNENLAREILELHTLGADGGYAQQDVEGLARLLTGWSVSRGADEEPDDPATGFHFRVQAHEPRAKVLMGRNYRQGGLEEGRQALRDLAAHPSTASHLARKLARHFVADEPPPEAVARLERAWRDSDGDLRQVHQALVNLDAAWEQAGSKVRDPEDWLTACGRALALDELDLDTVVGETTRGDRLRKGLVSALALLGQVPFSAPSPAGWPDTAAELVGGEALVQRIELAERLSERLSRAVPRAPELAASVLGEALGARTALALERAPDRSQALALFLCCPELVRR